MCDNGGLDRGLCFTLYAEPGQIITDSTVFNLLCGFILFATFFLALRRFYLMNMNALGGVNSGFLLPVHVFFLYASTVWAVCWSVYKVFSTDRKSDNWAYYHYFADSRMTSPRPALLRSPDPCASDSAVPVPVRVPVSVRVQWLWAERSHWS
jgi:hypothetical protein